MRETLSCLFAHAPLFPAAIAMEDREYTEVDDEPTTMMYEELGKARGKVVASADEDDGPTIVEIEQLYTTPVGLWLEALS